MSDIRTPWDHLPPPVIRAPREKPVRDPDALRAELGRKRKSAARYRRVPGDEGLFHHLIVVGPEEDIALFQEAARDPGIIPWRLDYASIE